MKLTKKRKQKKREGKEMKGRERKRKERKGKEGKGKKWEVRDMVFSLRPKGVWMSRNRLRPNDADRAAPPDIYIPLV